MGKEDRVGGMWKRSSSNPKAPPAKITIDCSRISDDVLLMMKAAIDMGGKIKLVCWANQWKTNDLESDDPTVRERAHAKPDWNVEYDRDERRQGIQSEVRQAAGQGPRRSVEREDLPVAPRKDVGPREPGDDFEDDIPF